MNSEKKPESGQMTPKPRRWRYSKSARRHYYVDDKYGYAYVDKRADRLWRWVAPSYGSGEEKTLTKAKAKAEAACKKRAK